MKFLIGFYIANEWFKVNDCVAIYSSNGALIDDDEILEDIEKFEVLVILRKGEIFQGKLTEKTDCDQGEYFIYF